jgi:hypothetical protein
MSIYSIFRSQEAREDPDLLRNTFPPVQGKKMPMGDVFTSCNWVIRDGLCSFRVSRRDAC